MLSAASKVAQACSLLYRRLAACQPSAASTHRPTVRPLPLPHPILLTTFLLSLLHPLHLTSAAADSKPSDTNPIPTTIATTATTTPITNTLVLGLLLPPEETQSSSLRDGAQLAVDQANKTAGQPVALIVRGRVGQWGADAVEAGKMVLDDHAAALIAPPDGSASHLALQVSGRTAVPVVTLCPDSSVSTTGVPWFLRLVPRTTEEAQVIFTNLNFGSNSPKRWVALVPTGRAGREAASDLQTAAQSAGCVLLKSFEMANTNRAFVMSQVLKTNAEGILLWLEPQSASACVKLLKLANYSGAVAGPLRLHSPELLSLPGSDVDGLVLPGVSLDPDTETRFAAFEAVFRHQFKREPDMLSAFSFDAAALLIQVLRGVEPQEVRKLFPLTNTYAGVTGPLTFDPSGNRKMPLRLLQADSGQFVPVGMSKQ